MELVGGYGIRIYFVQRKKDNILDMQIPNQLKQAFNKMGLFRGWVKQGRLRDGLREGKNFM